MFLAARELALMRQSTLRDSLPDAAAEADERPTAAPGTSEVGDLWRIVWCRREWVAGVMALCVAAAIVYVLLVPQQYSSTAQILIDPRDRQILTKDVTPDTLAADGGVLQVESQSRVIESDAVLLRAVTTLGLDHDPEYDGTRDTFASKLIGAVVDLFSDAPTAGANAAENRALRNLRKNLTVKRADKVFVVDLVVTAKSADKAARVADAIADAYLADQIETRSTSSLRASDALGGRLDDLRNAVRDAEANAERYKADHDIVGTEKELVTDLQLDNINAKLADARAKTAEQRARVQQIEALRRSGADSGAIPEAQASTVIIQLRASYQDLVRREIDLRTKVGERHPDLIAIVAQVGEAKRQINAELARLAQSAQSDYDRATANERSLAASLDTSKQRTLSQSQASIQLHELNREVEARRAVYQAFLSRAGETKAQADIDTGNARIISRAIPPDRPSFPTRPFIIVSAIGGGLGLGIGLALLLEYLAPTVLSPGHLRRLVEAPVIRVASQAGRRGFWRRKPRAASPESGNDPDGLIALALSRMCGPLSAMRTAKRSCSLMFTSGQGDAAARARIVDRLVQAAVAHNISVLLVDADLANNFEEAPGLLDVLRGECRLSAAALAHGPNLKLLGVGTAQSRSTDDLERSAIGAFLDQAGIFFDLIVFDAGAFEQNLRIAALAARVDEVLLVTVQGVTRLKAVLETTDAVLTASGRPVSAALLFDAAA